MIGVAGFICVDLTPGIGEGPFVFVPGRLLEVGKMVSSAGGVVGNTGGALCRLGVSSRLIAITGEDSLASMLADVLHTSLGADAPLELRAIKGAGTAYSVVLNPKGQDRMFLTFRGVNDAWNANTLDDAFFQGLTMFHFGYPPLCEGMAKNNGEETLKLYKRCHSKGIVTSLDMTLPSPGTFSWDMDWRAFLENVLPENDIFCPSIDELRFFLKDNTSTPDEMAQELIRMGTKAVLLKMGADGLMVRVADTEDAAKLFAKFGTKSWRGEMTFVPPKPVEVKGTTGAGDTAIAGFLAAIHEGYSAKEAADIASRAAASRISSDLGMNGIPKLAELP